MTPADVLSWTCWISGAAVALAGLALTLSAVGRRQLARIDRRDDLAAQAERRQAMRGEQ